MKSIVNRDRFVLFTLVSLAVIAPVPVKAENFQPLSREQLNANPHLCSPLLGQSENNGIVITQIVGHNCQSYINGAFNLEAVREQEETKREQFETNAKLSLFQLFLSIPRQQ